MGYIIDYFTALKEKEYLAQGFFIQRAIVYFIGCFLLTFANIKLLEQYDFLKTSINNRQILFSLFYGILRMYFSDLPFGL